MTVDQLNIAKELTLAVIDKMVFEFNENNSEYNANIANQVSIVFSKLCDAIVEAERK